MDAVRKNLLEETYERIINVGLCIVPYEDLSDIAAPELMFFGTTKDEKVFSFSELDAMFKSQYEQMDGFVNSLDRKRLFTRTSNDGKNAFITEEVTLTMTSPEEVNTIFMRCSCVMEYIVNQWKLTHLHASTPVDTENDHWHMEEWKRENEKLQKLVDQQTADLQDKYRELEIEAALERVRARTMAMQHSDELMETSELMFEQIKNLGIELWSCGFSLWYDDDSYFLGYNPGPDGKMGEPLRIPLTEDDFFTTIREAKRRGDEFLVFESEGDSLKETYRYMDTLPVVGETMRGFVEAGYPLPTYQVTHCGFFSNGHLMFILQEKNPEATEIFQRFTKVFNQTYTRFLDLQKAETQARETEIELALERVRARTMSMQKSEELADVAFVLFEQLRGLGGNLWGTGFGLCKENRDKDEFWFANENGVFPPVSIPNTVDPAHKKMYDGWKNEIEFLAIEGTGQELKNHYEYMMTLPEVRPFFQKILDEGLSFPEWQQWNAAYFTHGYLLIITLEPYSDQEILKRFARVFDQTYTRFLDLQKAEAQAREAQIELSMERIRAQVTSMQESSDLLDIVVTMRTEFVNLGHEAHYFWHMRWLTDHYKKAMTSGDGTKIGMVMTLPRHIHGDIEPVAKWEKSDESTYVLAMEVDEAVDYIDKMITLGDFEKVDPQAPTLDDIRHIGGLTFIMARTTHGEIGYSLPGVVPKPPTDALDTLVSFAGVFDLAYKRFEDLKAAEQQALLIREERDRLEIALKELHATQDQLIQQEKLASLGQLTAGIAHEIKNPLNFVNNFSDLSVELIEQTKEELSALSDQLSAEDREKVDEVLEILSDIDSNLRKIHQHGTRADSIVKSMLEHSRGGSGKVEATDLNSLLKEFVTLSFHGMRAGKDPINVDLKFDLDESITEVPLIAEDFSRVIINLSNNAFDAMREKLSADGGQLSENLGQKYKPKLTIRTIKENQATFIEIQDNGFGISEDIKDKILQPFFTTKKGTEGTGLGLSITNDIIKAHGGSLEVTTKQNEGTTFTIKLPTGG